jgi:UDP-glucose-4-epimerase GalE
MSEKRVLVTGGAGYIGSHVCKILKKSGYFPVVYDNLVHGHKDFVQWGPFEYGDIRDTARVLQVIQKYQPISVMHFAAFGYVGESVNDPIKYYENNVLGTMSLLRAMNFCGVKDIVFSSTCATYGIPSDIPIVEDLPQRPINPYGWSKLFIEQILKDYANAYGLKSVIFRYFNAAGADNEGAVGEDHCSEMHLIPLIFDVALGKKDAIDVFGDDYPTRDGTCVRDYLHVLDIAEAHVLALKYLEKNGVSNIFNLGTGKGYSVKEIIATVEKITGKVITINIKKRRHGDPAILIADAKKAQAFLGWSPKYASLDILIDHAWNWHKKRFSSSM